MEINKAKSLTLMAQRRIPVAVVEDMTKFFVADVKYRNMDPEGIIDNPPAILKNNGVSMHLNPNIVDLDVDGPPEWQEAVHLAMLAIVGPKCDTYAFKRSSLVHPTHYLFSSDVQENVMQVRDVPNVFPVGRYCPVDDFYNGNVAMEFRTSIGEVENEKLHTVLPGSRYPKKQDPDTPELLEWVSRDNDVRITECPNGPTMRRVLFASLTAFLFGRYIDEGMMLGNDKLGRHSFYLTLMGWMRRNYINYAEDMCFVSEIDFRDYCDIVIKIVCAYTNDEEVDDRLNVVKSTFKAKIDNLGGSPAFIGTFKELYGGVSRIMNDMAVLLGVPARPAELTALFEGTAMDVSSGRDLMFVQVVKDRAWDAPDHTIRQLNKHRLEAMYNSFSMKVGEKLVSVARIYQNSVEMKIVTSRVFDRLITAGEMKLMEIDEVSKRQNVTLNTFLGHPFDNNLKDYTTSHYSIKWIEGTVKLLTQTDDEARWLIARVASIFKNPEMHFRTMPVLIGEEATGKSKFADMVAIMVGGMYSHQLGTKDLTQADSFTGFLEDKVYVYATEIELNKMTVQDRLKSWSADRTIDVQGKGKEARTIKNPIRLIIMATNKDELQALNQHSTSEDTRLALFRAKSKEDNAKLRVSVIKHYTEIENAMHSAQMGQPREAIRCFSNLATYFQRMDSPFMEGKYDLKSLEKPPETYERELLRATQLPREYNTVFQMLNEPVIVQAMVGAYRRGDILGGTNALKGCIFLSRHVFINAINRMKTGDRKKADRYMRFFTSPSGAFNKVMIKLCAHYTEKPEVSFPVYKRITVDGKKISAVKIPPYMSLVDFTVSSYGELSRDKFMYAEECNKNGYLSEELSDLEVMASIGLNDDSSF